MPGPGHQPRPQETKLGKQQTPAQHAKSLRGRVCHTGQGRQGPFPLPGAAPHSSCLPHAGLFVLVSPPASVVSWLQFSLTGEFLLASRFLPHGLSVIRERYFRSWLDRTNDDGSTPPFVPVLMANSPSTHLQMSSAQLCPPEASAMNAEIQTPGVRVVEVVVG